MNEFRFGILGPGRIANKFAQSIPFSEHGVLQAVGSTNLFRSKEFAVKYQIPRAFDSYEDLLKSGEVDAVYIATTNQLHFSVSTLALEMGVPVLCEKPLTLSFDETRKLTDLSKTRQVFLMEGMWSLFLPHIRQTLKWIEDGKIGELVHVQADFGFQAMAELDSRIFNPDLGGGVTKDIGVYPISLFLKLLGPFSQIQKIGSRSKSGVDDHVLFQGFSESGASFQGMVSFKAKTNVEANIYGTKGKIRLGSQWLRPVSAVLETDSEVIEYHPEVSGFGFQYEVNEVCRCIRLGKIESDFWPHKNSIQVAEYIQTIERF